LSVSGQQAYQQSTLTFKLKSQKQLGTQRGQEPRSNHAVIRKVFLRAPNKMIVAPGMSGFISGKEGEAGHPRMVDGA
jgi:hypothetical protein